MANWAYPPYPFKPRDRVLALDNETDLVTEDGETLPSSTYTEWVESALSAHLDTRCAKIGQWRYFDEAISDPTATVSAVKNAVDLSPRVTRIDWRRGNRWCTLYPAEAWGGDCSPEALATHREACDVLGVGTYATPGSLGDAALRETLSPATAASAKLRRLPWAVQRDIESALIGMRTETFAGPGFYAQEAFEVDRSSAYVTECLSDIPCGRVVRLFDEKDLTADQWYICRAVVTILRSLPLGPFPIRDKSGDLTWPTERGVYQGVWLTRGEVSDTRAAGCLVQILDGWVWTDKLPVLRTWAEKMLSARLSARSKPIAAYLKRAGNAAIGRLAMTGSPLMVKTGNEGEPIQTDGQITAYVAVPNPKMDVVTLPHIALFIWSEARRHQYAAQLAELEAGNVVLLTNTDNLLLLYPPKVQHPGWKQATLHNIVIVTERSFTCREKIVLPGQTGQQRETTAEWAERRRCEMELMRVENPMEYWRQQQQWKRKRGIA